MAGSLRPSEAKSGGLLDDADVTIKQARFVRYDYGGKAEKPALALAVEMVDAENQAHIEYYSAGDLKFFIPTADGKGYDTVGEKTVLYKSCNTIQFLESLVKAGFPESKLGDDIGVIDGLKVHVSRVPQKKRTFQDGRKAKEDATILLVDKILGEVAAAPAAVDLTTKAIEAVQKALAANAGQLPAARVALEVFKVVGREPQGAEILKAVTPEFLSAAGRPWLFDQAAGLLIAQ